MKIEPLDRPPISGSVEEAWFDAYGDCSWFMFHEDTTRWAGVFGRGPLSGVNCAVPFNENKSALISACGQGYVVDTKTRKLCFKAGEDCLQGMIASSSADLVAACDFSQVYLYNPFGLVATSGHMEFDGIEFLGIEAGYIFGRGEFRDSWRPFKLEVPSLRFQEGGTTEHKKFER